MALNTNKALVNKSLVTRMFKCPPNVLSTVQMHTIQSKTIILDPGITTFMTGVDTNGNIYRFGRDWRAWAASACEIDYNADKDLPFFSSTVLKMKNHTKDYISGNFNKVILPYLDIKGSNIDVVNYGANVLNHPKFHRELSKLVNVIKVDEAYTSSMCYRCDYLRMKEWSHNFYCDRCLLDIDRDIHGALNIWKKYCSIVY
jgi:transposase